MFWYHMSGRDVGMLNVYLHESHNSQVTLWSRSGDQGDRWRPGRVTVASPLGPYQVYVQAILYNWSIFNNICKKKKKKLLFSMS